MDATWAQLRERGGTWGLRFLFGALRLFGRNACLALLAPAVLFFYVTGGRQRRASRDFLRRARALGASVGAGHWAGLRHAYSFGAATVDRFAAWSGGIAAADIEGVDAPACRGLRADPAGAVLIGSHIGSVDVIRAIATLERRRRVIVLLHSRNAVHFFTTLAATAPLAMVEVMEVGDVGVETAIRLSAAIDGGAWVVIDGDRCPPAGTNRVTAVPFMGAPANFPHGPFLLAAALGCPVFTLFLVKRGSKYRMYLDRFSERVVLPRERRAAALAKACARYAAVLERRALADPFQWFNFFDFWAGAGTDADHRPLIDASRARGAQ